MNNTEDKQDILDLIESKMFDPDNYRLPGNYLTYNDLEKIRAFIKTYENDKTQDIREQELINTYNFN